jgi:hypothetical protein
MKVFDHLVQWDQLDLRVSGHKVQETISNLLREKQLPVSDLRLEFLEGRLVVSAKIRKGLSVPLQFTVSTIAVVGRTLEVSLENVETFGILPVPKLLFRLIGERRLPDGITLNTETLTVTVWLERLLPGFIADNCIDSIDSRRTRCTPGKGRRGSPCRISMTSKVAEPN